MNKQTNEQKAPVFTKNELDGVSMKLKLLYLKQNLLNLVRFCFEWRLSDEELVTENSERPEVDFFVVEASLDHLWRQIVQCSAPRRKYMWLATLYKFSNLKSIFRLSLKFTLSDMFSNRLGLIVVLEDFIFQIS